MSCDLTPWIPLVSTAVGGLIGFGSAWIAGHLQARREKDQRAEARLDRDRQDLRAAYHRWFAMVFEMSIRLQVLQMETDILALPGELATRLKDQVLSGLREASMVMHGVFMLEGDKEARVRMGVFLGKISLLGAKVATGGLSDVREAMTEWATIHAETAKFQEWLVESRFGDTTKDGT
jgi:hypothetical protein